MQLYYAVLAARHDCDGRVSLPARHARRRSTSGGQAEANNAFGGIATDAWLLQ